MRRGTISNTVKKKLYTQSEVLEKLREFKSAHGEEYGIEVLGLFGSFPKRTIGRQRYRRGHQVEGAEPLEVYRPRTTSLEIIQGESPLAFNNSKVNPRIPGRNGKRHNYYK